MRSAALVRRPVFDRTLEVVAYEIVLGVGPIAEIAAMDDPESEGRRIVINSAAALDLNEIGAERPLQLTVLSSAIEAGLPPELNPDQTMLVLGAGVDSSRRLVAALEEYKACGFRILLDDVEANPQLHPLLRLADGAKVNFEGSGDPFLAKRVAILKDTGKELIADRIGSYEELTAAIKFGFDCFQGSFFSRPSSFQDGEVSAGQLAGLELITLLLDPQAELSDIAELIRRDVSLSYRILRVVNSAQYSLSRPLSTIEEAVMMVGTSQIVSWVGLMNMTRNSDKPKELTRVALTRARACEAIGERLGREDLRRFYTVGLFSVIEALLDVPAERALQQLPLENEIVEAITSRNGIMGEVLRGVIAYEEGDWSRAHVLGLKEGTLSSVFRTAMADTDMAWKQVTA